MKNNLFIFIISSILLFACEEAKEAIQETTVVEKDSISEIQKDTLAEPGEKSEIIRDYVLRVQEFKKMPDATKEDQVVKYEVFAERYIDYLVISKNPSYYSPIEEKENNAAFEILRDQTFVLKEKMKKNGVAFSRAEENRLDAMDTKLNKAITEAGY